MIICELSFILNFLTMRYDLESKIILAYLLETNITTILEFYLVMKLKRTLYYN